MSRRTQSILGVRAVLATQAPLLDSPDHLGIPPEETAQENPMSHTATPRRLTHTLLAPAVGSALALGLATTAVPAYAEGKTTHDATGDIYKFNEHDFDNTDLVPAPRHRKGDTLKLRVAHTERVVRFKLSVSELEESKRVDTFATFAMKTNTGKRANLEVLIFGDGVPDEPYFYVDGAGVRRDKCPGARIAVNYDADTVVARVPRKCLNYPKWVKGGAGLGSLTRTTTYVDDVNIDGAPGQELKLGPRVRTS